ncbi:MAG TPA: hypothetical protein PL063_01210 [Candidatus Cloacimonadota bacterium]|jgi:hypothetical protein|nr:hypothetical protein [Candidatus Cloacimonadales bacterium]HPY95810.1 hypothetical protein [Candidatus Cloacimonadota bacterium]HQB40513.1 hypothetical protein [Candidatus Cloacimonadota bacterium]
MKKALIILILIISCNLMAQKVPFELSLTGNPFYNSIRAASIDVDNPNNQPIIFTVRVANQSNRKVDEAYMSFTLKWNGNMIINKSLSSFKDYSLNVLNNTNSPLIFTNRDIINDNGSLYLSAATPSITLNDFLNNPLFKSAIMNTGLFPDGVYEFIMQIKSSNNPNSTPLSNEAIYVMNIHNVSNIVLITPGAQAGQPIPNISQRPIVYSWSANISNPANPYIFEIREFAQESSINTNNIANSGRLFYQETKASPIFNENLEYIENNFYAWRVSVPLTTDQSQFGGSPMRHSPWYLFKYVSSSISIPSPYTNLLPQLEALQSPVVSQLINQQFVPTGTFYHDNNKINASQALTIIQQILNSQSHVIEIID